MSGVMFNTENAATDYQTGDELHLGFALAQHFSPRFGVAFVGYYYDQISDDEGPLVDKLRALGRIPGGFQGRATRLGGALKWTPEIVGRDVNLVVKYLHDVDTRNRFDGYRVFLSAAFGF